MAGINIQFDSGKALDAIHAAAQAVEHPSELFHGIGEYLLIAHRERWDRQQSPDGTPWSPLSPRYMRRKAKLRPGRPLLVFDNILRGTLRYQADDAGVAFGTDRPYGARQQFGGGGIPARPWLGLSADDENEIVAMTQDYLRAAIDAAGAADTPAA